VRDQDKAFYTICLVGLAGGAAFLFLGVVTGSNAIQFLGLLAAVVSAGLAVYKWRQDGGKVPGFVLDTTPRTVIARIESKYRTELGQIVTDRELELEHPNYHLILVSETGERMDVTASEQAYGEALEASWGYADFIGRHVNSFRRDADLYRRFNP
jgi:hypothetical protein